MTFRDSKLHGLCESFHETGFFKDIFHCFSNASLCQLLIQTKLKLQFHRNYKKNVKCKFEGGKLRVDEINWLAASRYALM